MPLSISGLLQTKYLIGTPTNCPAHGQLIVDAVVPPVCLDVPHLYAVSVDFFFLDIHIIALCPASCSRTNKRRPYDVCERRGTECKFQVRGVMVGGC